MRRERRDKHTLVRTQRATSGQDGDRREHWQLRREHREERDRRDGHATSPPQPVVGPSDAGQHQKTSRVAQRISREEPTTHQRVGAKFDGEGDDDSLWRDREPRQADGGQKRAQKRGSGDAACTVQRQRLPDSFAGGQWTLGSPADL